MKKIYIVIVILIAIAFVEVKASERFMSTERFFRPTDPIAGSAMHNILPPVVETFYIVGSDGSIIVGNDGSKIIYGE